MTETETREVREAARYTMTVYLEVILNVLKGSSLQRWLMHKPPLNLSNPPNLDFLNGKFMH